MLSICCLRVVASFKIKASKFVYQQCLKTKPSFLLTISFKRFSFRHANGRTHIETISEQAEVLQPPKSNPNRFDAHKKTCEHLKEDEGSPLACTCTCTCTWRLCACKAATVWMSKLRAIRMWATPKILTLAPSAKPMEADVKETIVQVNIKKKNLPASCCKPMKHDDLHVHVHMSMYIWTCTSNKH